MVCVKSPSLSGRLGGRGGTLPSLREVSGAKGATGSPQTVEGSSLDPGRGTVAEPLPNRLQVSSDGGNLRRDAASMGAAQGQQAHVSRIRSAQGRGARVTGGPLRLEHPQGRHGTGLQPGERTVPVPRGQSRAAPAIPRQQGIGWRIASARQGWGPVAGLRLLPGPQGVLRPATGQRLPPSSETQRRPFGCPSGLRMGAAWQTTRRWRRYRLGRLFGLVVVSVSYLGQVGRDCRSAVSVPSFCPKR